MSDPDTAALKFPSVEWFRALQELVNEDEEFGGWEVSTRSWGLRREIGCL